MKRRITITYEGGSGFQVMIMERTLRMFLEGFQEFFLQQHKKNVIKITTRTIE